MYLNKKRWMASLLACSLVLSMTGCAGTNTEESESGTEKSYQANLDMITPSEYSTVDGITLEDGIYISIIGKATKTSYWKAVKKGIEQATDDLNEELGLTGKNKLKVTYNAPDKEEDIDEQVNILDEELSRYPDIIAVASIDETACEVQFDLALENGIPILSFDSSNSYQSIPCTVQTDNEAAGQTVAQKMAEAIDDSGDVLLVVHDTLSEASINRSQGFISEMEQNHPDISTETVLYLDKMNEYKSEMALALNADKNLTDEDLKKQVETYSDEDVIAYYMEQCENLKGVYGTTAESLNSILGAEEIYSKEHGDGDHICIMGIDGGDDLMKSLRNGTIDGLLIQNPFGIGYATVIAAARDLCDEDLAEFVDTGVIWVTAENIDDEEIQAVLYE